MTKESQMDLFDRLTMATSKEEFLELQPKVFPDMTTEERDRLLKELNLQ